MIFLKILVYMALSQYIKDIRFFVYSEEYL
jgi:hypothetical protein